jgi:hypothetical protein
MDGKDIRLVRSGNGGTVAVNGFNVRYGWRREGEYPNETIFAAIEGRDVGYTPERMPVTCRIDDPDIYREAKFLIRQIIGPSTSIIVRDQ